MPAQMQYTAVAFSQNTIWVSLKAHRLCFSFSTFYFFLTFFFLFCLGLLCPAPTHNLAQKSNKNLCSPISLSQQELAQVSCSAWWTWMERPRGQEWQRMKERITRKQTDIPCHFCNHLNDDLTYWCIQCKAILSKVSYRALISTLKYYLPINYSYMKPHGTITIPFMYSLDNGMFKKKPFSNPLPLNFL